MPSPHHGMTPSQLLALHETRERWEQRQRDERDELERALACRAAWEQALAEGGRAIVARWVEDVVSGRRQLIPMPEPGNGVYAVVSDHGIELPGFASFGEAVRALAQRAAAWLTNPDRLCSGGPSIPTTERGWLHLLDGELVSVHVVRVTTGTQSAARELLRPRGTGRSW